MAKPFKILELLKDKPDELAELEAFARPGARTGEEIFAWLKVRGYDVSISGVYGWLANFRADIQRQRMAAASGVAQAIREAAVVGGGGTLAIADAGLLKLQQMILEHLMKMELAGEVTTEGLTELSLAFQRGGLSLARFEDARAEMRRQQQAAIAEAKDAVKKGADAKSAIEIVERFMEGKR